MKACRAVAAVVLVWSSFFIASCTDDGGQPGPGDSDTDCLGCHGDETSTAPTDSLHAVHLTESEGFAAVACDACHVVPETVSAPGHDDGDDQAEVTFGGAAVVVYGDADGAEASAPSYAPGTGTCSSVACHGAGLDGGTATDPVWDEAAIGQAECDACHGNPPTAEHPAGETCSQCHPTGAAQHVDGALDTALPEACETCHGDEASSAPLDLVHRTHALGTDSSAAVACAACHVVPEATGDPGHLDAPPAEVVFGGQATAGGAEPTYLEGSCSDTYCHAARPGGNLPEPSWTDETGAASACDACHGNPMLAPHPIVEDCSLCHGEVASVDAIVAPDKHVDGGVNLELPKECGACHGVGDDPLPLDSAHATHMETELTVLACESCHIVPGNIFDPGHVDSEPPVEVVFDHPATAGGAEPTWASPTCAGTACHSGKSVEWTDDLTGPAACDACHGTPPAAPHPVDLRCEACHAKVAGPDITLKNKLLHIDGAVSVDDTPECALCHGTPPEPPHPVSPTCEACHSAVAGPELTLLADSVQHADGTVDYDQAPACNACHGSETTSAPDTGAHLAHDDYGFSCAACHIEPETAYDAGHVDTDLPAEVVFGAAASAGSDDPGYDVDTATCSSVYCHGGGTMGGSHMSPQWTEEGSSAGSCGSCHALPPPAPHPDDFDCGGCHGDTLGSSAHVDGVVDFGD